MNWYKLAATLQETLRSLNALPETAAWVESLPAEQRGYYVAALKKNPSATPAQLQALVSVPAPKLDPYLPHERQLAQTLPSRAQQWALATFKQLRNSDLDFPRANNQSDWLSISQLNPEYARFANKLDYWRRTNGLRDLLQFNPRYDVNGRSFDEVDEDIHEWHAVMAGQGQGKFYGPQEQSLVVYGPKWKNPEWDGHTIQEVKTRNDLEVEGNLMNHCFAPGALVRAKLGWVAIESVSIGDEVLCEDGSFRRVVRTFEQPYSGTVVRFGTRLGVGDVLVTPNHEFRVLVPKHRKAKRCSTQGCGNPLRVKDIEANHDLAWVPIGELSADNYFQSCVPTSFDDRDKIEIPDRYLGEGDRRRVGDNSFALDADFLWICGLYVAEGSVNWDKANDEKNALQFGLSKDEESLATRVIRYFEARGYNPDIRKDRDDYGGLVVLVRSRKLAEWFFDWFGHKCDEKAIPHELMNLPNDKLRHVVAGILDGDGCRSSNCLHQTSPTLALQIVEAGLRLSGCPTTSRKDNEGKKASYRTENADPAAKRSRRFKNTWSHRGNRLIRPKTFSREPYDGLVYNLEVEGVHSYVVHNILVHNCVGGFCHAVESGQSRIFSLRDPQNHPLVTMETDDEMTEFRQIMANSNEEPEENLRAMIKEWVLARWPDDAAAPFFNDGTDDWGIEPSNVDEYLNYIDTWGERNGYGLMGRPIQHADWAETIDTLLGLSASRNYRNHENEYSYSGDITRADEALVGAALRGGPQEIYNLWTVAEQKSDEALSEMQENWFFDGRGPFNPEDEPDPKDYEFLEDDEEYKRDYKAWEEAEERAREEAELESLNEAISGYAPAALPRDIVKALHNLARRGEIPTREELEARFGQKNPPQTQQQTQQQPVIATAGYRLKTGGSNR